MRKFLISSSAIFYIKQVLFSLVVFVIVLNIVLFALSIYTSKGYSLEIPSFEGMSIEEAKEVAKVKGLRLKLYDSLYVANHLPETVIDQYPPAESKVKKNRLVFLTINQSNPDKVEIPNVIDISLRQAKVTLALNNLRVGEIEYVYSPYKDLILEQKYKGEKVVENMQVPKGSYIDLVIGRDTSKGFAKIPNLIGRTLSEIKDISVGLSSIKIGKIETDHTVRTTEDRQKAIVWKQIPTYEPDKYIYEEETIHIWLTNPDF